MDISITTKLNRRKMALLEFMNYGVKQIRKFDEEIRPSTSHDRLKEIAGEYDLFAYQAGQVVAQLFDMCDKVDSSLSFTSEYVEKLESRDTALQRLLKILRNRQAPEDASIPLNDEPIGHVVYEQDSLLRVVEELLSGNVDDFEKDMADFEVEASE